MRLLQCPVQTYHWGKLGNQSLVARLGLLGGHLSCVDQETHYAELWMGTHPSKPSVLQESPSTLLREKCGDLSFLFKVLSVDTALSIQAHPNRSHAVELRAKDPQNYPDSNHKPEIAIALTDFEALCCFRPLEEISSFVRGVPELKSVVGALTIESKADLKKAFSTLMTCPPDVFQPQLEKLSARLGKPDEVVPDDLRQIVRRLSSQYPGDIGIFNLFFLNFVKLTPGEALFLAANEPHAYLNGDCVECMATSDNVVRAGLTPKFKDVPTLVEMLSYNSIKDARFKPELVSPGCQRFRPPVDDFAVLKYDVRGEATTEEVNSPSIAIVVAGNGTLSDSLGKLDVREGHVVYVQKGAQIRVEGSLTIFQAYSPA